VYDHATVPKRWTVVLPSSGPNQSENAEGIFIVNPVKAPKRPRALTSEDRYTQSMKICRTICAHLSNKAGNEYSCGINALHDMTKLLKEGSLFAVIGVDANNCQESKLKESTEFRKFDSGSHATECVFKILSEIPMLNEELEDNENEPGNK